MDTLTQIYQVINVNIHIFYTIIQKIYTRFNDIHAKFYLHTNFNIKHWLFLHNNSINIQRLKVYKQKYLFYLCILILNN